MRRTAGIRRGLLLGSIFAMVVGIAALATKYSRAQGEPENPCASCHEETVSAFALTAHGRAQAFGEGNGDCSSCHGNTAEHMASGEVTPDLLNPKSAEAGRTNEACDGCHGNEPSHAYWAGSDHQTAGLSCADCHAVHASSPPRRAQKIESQADLCTSCHVGEKKELNRRSHHPIREGLVECADCHDPHGSGTPGNLRADSVNDQCLSCHEDKRGPFLWEHSPVREDCLTCHQPHGSNHEGLLVTRTAQLCQSCHLQGRHQTVAGTENAPWYVSRQCLNCHSQIHGSNHPSGVLFQR